MLKSAQVEVVKNGSKKAVVRRQNRVLSHRSTSVSSYTDEVKIEANAASDEDIFYDRYEIAAAKLLRRQSTKSRREDDRGGDVVAIDDASERDGTRAYWPEFMAYLFRNESRHLIDFRRILLQQGDKIVAKRQMLLNWLIEICLHFRVRHETVYHMVHLVDSFLSLRPASDRQLQLMGLTCFFIATKLEEYLAPEVSDLANLTTNLYGVSDILDMELTVVGTMRFRLYGPEPYSYIHRFLQAAFPSVRMKGHSLYRHGESCFSLYPQRQRFATRMDHEVAAISLELVESVFLFYDSLIPDVAFSSLPASLKAAAALFLGLIFNQFILLDALCSGVALSDRCSRRSRIPILTKNNSSRLITDEQDEIRRKICETWTPTLVAYTGYKLYELRECGCKMLRRLCDTLPLSEVRRDSLASNPSKYHGVVKMYLSRSQHCALLSLPQFARKYVVGVHKYFTSTQFSTL